MMSCSENNENIAHVNTYTIHRRVIGTLDASARRARTISMVLGSAVFVPIVLRMSAIPSRRMKERLKKFWQIGVR